MHSPACTSLWHWVSRTHWTRQPKRWVWRSSFGITVAVQWSVGVPVCRCRIPGGSVRAFLGSPAWLCCLWPYVSLVCLSVWKGHLQTQRQEHTEAQRASLLGGSEGLLVWLCSSLGHLAFPGLFLGLVLQRVCSLFLTDSCAKLQRPVSLLLNIISIL